MALTVGAPAIDRPGILNCAYFTIVSMVNPATEAGVINVVELWLDVNTSTAVYVGIFSADGSVLTCRDSVNLGAVPAGSKQRYTGLSLNIEIGDYIGIHAKNGSCQIDCTTTGTGYWRFVGECIDPEDSETFSGYGGYTASLYGAYEAPPEEQELIASPVDVASSIQAAGVSGSGNSPLAAAVVDVDSSVQAPVIAGSGEALLTASSMAIASSVQNGTIVNVVEVQELTASPVDVSVTVQNASLAAIGAAELIATAIAVVSSIRNTALAAVGVATLTSVPIRVTSSIAAAIVSGSGVVSLSALPISVSTSVQAAITFRAVVLTYEEFTALQAEIVNLELALEPKAHFRI